MEEITLPYPFKLGDEFGLNQIETLIDKAREQGFEKVKFSLVSVDGDMLMEGVELMPDSDEH